ncbi:hypothetical protein GF359_10900 [candidate division WOR-3 bacterium]|uniref:Uncharacterized protein n=1 Tax=candidate division WOR-3 bacterium TaxID=2052148 RepID=A0A9D5KCR4_UNCW3|nr:hypothetical protein [candidate division WOR-3 bacterium]MBD3365710.1 hypothetical protein [candidate division WOR-3 bacterium]
MARTKFTNWLSLMGNRLFDFFSECEDRSRLKGIFRLFKLLSITLILLLLTTINANENDTEDQIQVQGGRDIGLTTMVDCYLISTIPEPYIQFKKISIAPNPTNGSKWVTLKIKAVSKTSLPITKATYYIDDSEPVQIKPRDGECNERREYFKTKVFIGNLSAGEHIIVAQVFNSDGDSDSRILQIIVSPTVE